GRVLARGGAGKIIDQAHAQGTVRADGLEHGQRLCIAVDRVLQLGAGVADVGGVDEDRRDADVDHRGPERADAGNLQVVDQVAGGEHRAAVVAAVVGRVDELEHDLGRREGHAVELEV